MPKNVASIEIIHDLPFFIALRSHKKLYLWLKTRLLHLYNNHKLLIGTLGPLHSRYFIHLFWHVASFQSFMIYHSLPEPNWPEPTLNSKIDEQTGINKQVWKKFTLSAFLLSKLINEHGGISRLLHEKLRTGWKENLKNLSKLALLLGTSE